MYAAGVQRIAHPSSVTSYIMLNNLAQSSRCPGLLVSVRSAAEAMEALAGGADMIDVKEPKRGSLGVADMSTIAEVVRTVGKRAMVTAALAVLKN